MNPSPAAVRQLPAIRQFMSATPYTIGLGSSIAGAHETMRRHHIRHLPVLDGDRIVGVLSERDLILLTSLPGVDARALSVEEAMIEDVFIVSPDAPVAEVIETMMERKLGSALVGTNSHIAGVFTTIDALHALHALLERP
jgi:acetoin utilization protein AcuB